ncbi:divalent-cation tolerance protein CutA [Streptomyces sp. NPDC020965]|uniref:divalent-cation tolerance protein CutA n=1 Tax=Streptomyces sp. NPDC020965 TaxID=3365105 RepID=UPI0037936BB0
MTTTPDHAVVTTTTATEAAARTLAARAVEERLAACAQIYPISSVYRWEGAIAQDREWRVDFKTRGDLVERLSAFLTEHHDYETPEVIAVPVVAGSAGYLDWVTRETRPDRSGPAPVSPRPASTPVQEIRPTA